nr:PREDICTED: specifically androgen-regulated gene protein-like [Paralichthys olivaceus]
MTKNDTWPRGVAMESLSNMDSAGSCESVISMNSGYSEDSMEHLSAEERACLMYLEETIEALEVQEDSGFSNDEPDAGLQADKMGRTNVNDIFSIKPDHEPPSHPVSAAATEDLIPSSLDVMTQPSGSQTPPSAPQSEALCVTTDGNGNPKIVTSSRLRQGQSNVASAKHLALIPPPSDFMDKPRPNVHLDKLRELHLSSNKPRGPIDLEQLRQRATVKRTLESSSMTQESPNMPPPEVLPGLSPPAIISSPQMSPPSNTAGLQMSLPMAAEPQMSPPPMAAGLQMSLPPMSAEPQMSPPMAAEPRSPPAVAPKPKKLPANIILKSHKASASGSDGNSGHSFASSSDRMLDPIRFEALRKLGLLKGDEADPGPALSPGLSPRTRSSWGASHSPGSQAAPRTPPSITHVNSPPPVSFPLLSPAAVPPSVEAEAPDILPAPADFSDPIGPLTSDYEPSAAIGVSNADVQAQQNTPPLTPLKLTPPRIVGVKSATLERAGPGLRSSLAMEGSSNDGELSPRQLRNNRPRPASLGSGKEFSSTQRAAVTHQDPDSLRSLQVPRRSLPGPTVYQHSRDTQKLPRSEGISVLICPRSENEEDRREALKKLGLLRD